jgi:acyl-CoA reductase-like NAD-dependent aldehyde dehydrogenase
MGEMLANTSLPDGAFSILPTLPEDASMFSTHPDIKMVSFTGSVGVGWAIKAAAGKKKVVRAAHIEPRSRLFLLCP